MIGRLFTNKNIALYINFIKKNHALSKKWFNIA